MLVRGAGLVSFSWVLSFAMPRFGSGCGTSFCAGFMESRSQMQDAVAEAREIAEVLNADPRGPVGH